MKKKISIVVAILLLCGIFISLYKLVYLPNLISPGQVKIVYKELFEGELEKIEPHLNYFTTADMLIKHKSDKKGVIVYFEEWENGEIKKDYPITEIKDLCEITITTKEDQNKESFDIRLVVYGEDFNMSTTFPIEKPVADLRYKSETAQDISSDTDSIGIWGIVGQNPPYYWRAGESVDEMSQRSKWAIVMKIKFTDELTYADETDS